MSNCKFTKLSPRLILLTILALLGNCPAFASNIVVTYINGKCQATVAGEQYQCSLGKNGLSKDKHEGDGTTPIGTFPLRKVFYRSDKIATSNLKRISLPVAKINPSDGWSDDPKDKRYNTLVDLNNFDQTISHEDMYRKDDTYNIVVEVGYNDDPIVPGKGSAVFVRVAEPDYSGTRGSVAFSQKDLLKILSHLDSNSKLIVQ